MQTLSEKLKRVYRIPEVARILDISEARVYELSRQGILPTIRLGRQIRIDHEALEKFLQEGGRALPGGWRREAK